MKNKIKFLIGFLLVFFPLFLLGGFYALFDFMKYVLFTIGFIAILTGILLLYLVFANLREERKKEEDLK